MNSNTKLSYAIAAILSGSGAAYAQTVTETPTAESADQIQTITVTAQRRSESIQDVPISIQAFTGQTLKELNVTTFDDYIKYLPNVSAASNGPGQNEIFMRGLSAVVPLVYSKTAGSSGSSGKVRPGSGGSASHAFSATVTGASRLTSSSRLAGGKR